MMQRYKILIEYDGTDFCGWQRQENGMSVQQVIEEAIYKFTRQETLVYGSGRTDSGVHALLQVAHFDIEKTMQEKEIIGAINYHSKPHKLVVLDCTKVDSNFHARFSAIERSYLYKIINRREQLIINENRAWQVAKELDFDAMRSASKYFIGKHDFTSFRASGCQGKSPIKTINKIELTKNIEEITMFISAPSFLHNMVRNIMGTLVEVGLGKFQPNKMKEIIEKRNRSEAGMTAPACGLYFLGPRY